jgi:hypothetical protein
MSNDMVKEEEGSYVGCIIECGHGFFPFCEVVDNDYYILVPITGWGVASHEINAPFAEGTCRYDGMERSRWCSGFVSI